MPKHIQKSNKRLELERFRLGRYKSKGMGLIGRTSLIGERAARLVETVFAAHTVVAEDHVQLPMQAALPRNRRKVVVYR